MISESGKQWFNELVNQWANESINQQSSESTNQWTNEWMIEQTNERNDTKWNKMKWNEWVNQSMKQWTIESSNQGTKEPRNQGTKVNESMNQWINNFAKIIFQKCSETRSVYQCLCVKSSSHYSHVHILPTSFSKTAPNISVFNHVYVKTISHCSIVRICALRPSVFSNFYVKFRSHYSLSHILPTPSSERAPCMWASCEFYLTWSSRYTVSCTFCRPHLWKVIQTWLLFLTCSSANQALATVLCTFCPQLVQFEAPAETETLLWW